MRAAAPILVAAVAALAAGCAGDLPLPYELDHDRIVAVRATPPRILPGERADIDALIGLAEGSPFEAPPEVATVVAPESLAGALRPEGGRWVVTAPDEPALAAARTALGLDAGAPVPLQIGVAYQGQSLFATKTVWLGASGANPSLDSATIDGAPLAAGTEIAVTRDVDVTLSVDFTEEDDVNWLTTVGETRDFDLPLAYLEVPSDDEEELAKTTGDLALVVRTPDGGVAWRVWPLRIAP